MIELPEIRPRKKPRAAYRKSEAIKLLESMAQEAAQRRFSTAARLGALAPRKYSDRTANGLTKCIIDFLQLEGHQAERISVQGRCVDNTKIVTDILGNRKRIGSIKWIPPSMTPGSADISATIKGRSVKLEVKIKDRQSQKQKDYQKQIEAAGGVYQIVRSFEEFLNFYNERL